MEPKNGRSEELQSVPNIKSTSLKSHVIGDPNVFLVPPLRIALPKSI